MKETCKLAYGNQVCTSRSIRLWKYESKSICRSYRSEYIEKHYETKQLIHFESKHVIRTNRTHRKCNNDRFDRKSRANSSAGDQWISHAQRTERRRDPFQGVGGINQIWITASDQGRSIIATRHAQLHAAITNKPNSLYFSATVSCTTLLNEN